MHNRWKRRGTQLYHLVMEVRRNRHGRRSWSDVATLVANWNREDKRHGRRSHDPELIPIIPKIYDA